MDPGSHANIFGQRINAANPSEAAASVKMAAYSHDVIEFTWDFSSFLAYGFALVWIVLLLIRPAVSLNLLNYIGLIGGIAGFIWLADFLPFTLPAGNQKFNRFGISSTPLSDHQPGRKAGIRSRISRPFSQSIWDGTGILKAGRSGWARRQAR